MILAVKKPRQIYIEGRRYPHTADCSPVSPSYVWWLVVYFLCFHTLETGIVCALCLHWNQISNSLSKKQTSQRASSASCCGFWSWLYPGIEDRGISCYRSQRISYSGQKNTFLYLQARVDTAFKQPLQFLQQDLILGVIICRDKTSRFFI